VNELAIKDGYQLDFEYDEEVNAITYDGDDQRVIVRKSVIGNNMRLEVIDNGGGIEQKPYIWEHYYKVDNKHKRPIKNTGFGLTIVKKVIELHNGEYGLESEVGKGSVQLALEQK